MRDKCIDRWMMPRIISSGLLCPLFEGIIPASSSGKCLFDLA